MASAPSTLRVAPLSAEHETDWERLALALPEATICHTPGWSRAVAQAFGHRPRHLAALRDERLVGALPLFEVRAGPLGHRLVSTPGAVYGGPLARDEAAACALVQVAARLARALRCDYLELRDREERPAREHPAMQMRPLYVTFEHPLFTAEAEQLKSFKRNRRTSIRKGLRSGLRVVFGRDDLVDPLYDLYAVSVRNLGTPVFPRKLFVGLLRELPAHSEIVALRDGARVVAAALCFRLNGTILPYYAGCNPDYLDRSADDLLYWSVMRRGVEQGCGRFDFGRSKLDTGACSYKRFWGMQERQLPYRYFLPRGGELPELNPSNPRLKPLIAAWRRLPVPLTRVLGPPLVRFLA
jgi:FemAB-related protein (PEP-CTERM system-associated)